MERWMFGEKPNELSDKVISGLKTATSSLYQGEVPSIGERSIIINSKNEDICMIEIIDFKILKYNEMTNALANLEGEGDLTEWKKVHRSFFSKELNVNKFSFDENTLILLEEFKVIEIYI